MLICNKKCHKIGVSVIFLERYYCVLFLYLCAMLSKNKIKYIQALSNKKFRDKYSVFIAEGEKLVKELLPYFNVEFLVIDSSLEQSFDAGMGVEVAEASSAEMKRISNLTSARNVLAVFQKPVNNLNFELINHSLSIALDGIQDPGNLGTILRIADWFGVKNVICSKETVDVYNPKVVQATMGALSRVQVHYADLAEFFKEVDVPVYGTFLEGDDLYHSKLTSHGILLMGNEGNGITKELNSFVTQKLFIPPYLQNSENVESLNVGVATAIICAEFRRKASF